MTAALSVGAVMSAQAQSTTPSFDNEQYQKALWMTTRFYGAQRSGEGPNWLLADHEPNSVPSALSGNLANFNKGKSFIKDADGDYDLTGGWFDCGDHVKFGQTEFYTAYMLLLGYSEFPEGYDDYYSLDYNGYISSGDYSWEGKKGKPNGIPDVLDEVRYATDYLMKCVKNANEFYYQVGDGDADHKHWITAAVMATLPVSEGGEAEGSRKVSKATGNVTSMASLCGSALATMSRLYKKYDPEYAQRCLDKALVAYEFVNGTAKGNSAAGGFYGAKPKYAADLVIFNAELYRTTGEQKYLTAAEANCTWMNVEADYNYNYSLCYNNTEDLAAYLIASMGDKSAYSAKAMSVMDFYINSMYKPTSGYMLNRQVGAWGKLRFPATQSFVHGLYNKLKGEMTTINPYSLFTIEYIMGKNSGNMSYITGFGDKSPNYVHHRNYYGYDGDKETAVTVRAKYRQLGYLVGGALDGTYSDVPGADYTYSEGGIDYNAGLVCALGYINSIVNKVDVNKFGHPTPNFGVADTSICGQTSITLNTGVTPSGNMTFTWKKDGVQVEQSNTASSFEATGVGEYSCEIDSAGQWSTMGSVKVVAQLPELTWEENIQLCSPATANLDLTLGLTATYQWFKNEKMIEKATTSTLLVTNAGTYKCEITAANCGTTTYTTEVTSLLPEVADAVSDKNGNIKMTVIGTSEYEWYDQAEGGTALFKGTTYQTKITNDTYFYVQDAGEMNLTVGPTTASFKGTGTNWGDIGAKFTTTKGCKITEISVGLGSIYNAGSQTFTAELAGAGKGTFTSDAVTLDMSMSGKFCTVTFSTPIEIPSAGEYTLTVKCSNGSVNYYSDMNNYDGFAEQGNPLTFTGTTNQNGGFPGLADWKVMTGSGCDRAVVKAVKGNGVGVEEAITGADIKVAPNPCRDWLYVKNTGLSGDVEVEIINMIGNVVKKIRTNSVQLNSGISVSDLSKGIYILRVKDDSRIITERFVKE